MGSLEAPVYLCVSAYVPGRVSTHTVGRGVCCSSETRPPLAAVSGFALNQVYA